MCKDSSVGSFPKFWVCLKHVLGFKQYLVLFWTFFCSKMAKITENQGLVDCGFFSFTCILIESTEFRFTEYLVFLAPPLPHNNHWPFFTWETKFLVMENRTCKFVVAKMEFISVLYMTTRERLFTCNVFIPCFESYDVQRIFVWWGQTMCLFLSSCRSI